MKKLISIIIPSYNEERNIPLIHQELSHILNSYEYEIIFVNDGSKDRSWKEISTICKNDSHTKGINFTRNFGHQIALAAGYNTAQGEAVITMDADMQDPPNLILEMIKKWESGYEIIYARRIGRDDGFLKRLTAHIYYKLLERISSVKIPRNVGDYRLIDKKVVDYIKNLNETTPYWRGIVAWPGFSHDFVEFARPNRLHGETGYSWKKMFQFAFDGLTSFSLFPLKISLYMGIFLIVLSLFSTGYLIFHTLFSHVSYQLFNWIISLLYLFIGLLFVCLWLIGEYIGRMFEQQKNRPLYVIKEKIES